MTKNKHIGKLNADNHFLPANFYVMQSGSAIGNITDRDY